MEVSMVEILATFAEVAAAIAMMILFSLVLNNKKNSDEHTMEPVRVPVKLNRKNRR
jgi:hypothetical protein